MNKKNYSFLVVVFLFFALIFSSKIYGKDLVFESDISLNSDTNEKFLTFRKYVRRYGTANNTDWSYGGTLGSGTNTPGSYVTIALVFHTKYGTNYTDDYGDLSVVRVAYDTNTKNISTKENTLETGKFFSTYGISGNNFTGIKLMSDSNVWNMGEFYTAQSVKLTRERTLDKMAITDFTIDGDSYVNLIGGVKEEISKGNVQEYAYDNNYYKVLVSGQLDAYAMNEKGKASTHFTQKDNIKTAQQLVDIMYNSATNAYYNNKINSVWTNNDFGFKEGYGTKGSSTVETGMSVLNNFDNTLLIPKSNILDNRHV